MLTLLLCCDVFYMHGWLTPFLTSASGNSASSEDQGSCKMKCTSFEEHKAKRCTAGWICPLPKTFVGDNWTNDGADISRFDGKTLDGKGGENVWWAFREIAEDLQPNAGIMFIRSTRYVPKPHWFLGVPKDVSGYGEYRDPPSGCLKPTPLFGNDTKCTSFEEHKAKRCKDVWSDSSVKWANLTRLKYLLEVRYTFMNRQLSQSRMPITTVAKSEEQVKQNYNDMLRAFKLDRKNWRRTILTPAAKRARGIDPSQ